MKWNARVWRQRTLAPQHLGTRAQRRLSTKTIPILGSKTALKRFAVTSALCSNVSPYMQPPPLSASSPYLLLVNCPKMHARYYDSIVIFFRNRQRPRLRLDISASARLSLACSRGRTERFFGGIPPDPNLQENRPRRHEFRQKPTAGIRGVLLINQEIPGFHRRRQEL
jgi:hypothetical protein